MWTVESGYFLIRCRHSIYLANLNVVADRRQIASVLLGLISSLLACMQLNVALLNAEISYARRRLDVCKLFTLSTGQNGRQKQLKRVGKQCRSRRFWVRPGRTSVWWDNFANPQWIRSESEYVWTGEFDMNTLWSHSVWTRIFSYPERKSCGFKNIRIRVDGALVFYYIFRLLKLACKYVLMRIAFFSIWPLNFELRSSLALITAGDQSVKAQILTG